MCVVFKDSMLGLVGRNRTFRGTLYAEKRTVEGTFFLFIGYKIDLFLDSPDTNGAEVITG